MQNQKIISDERTEWYGHYLSCSSQLKTGTLPQKFVFKSVQYRTCICAPNLTPCCTQPNLLVHALQPYGACTLTHPERPTENLEIRVFNNEKFGLLSGLKIYIRVLKPEFPTPGSSIYIKKHVSMCARLSITFVSSKYKPTTDAR